MSRKCDLLGTKSMFGNNVPNSNKKTRRVFLVNVQNVSYFSTLLNRKIKLKLTVRGMRTILKYGGLDECLLKMKARKLGEKCITIKKEMMKKVSV